MNDNDDIPEALIREYSSGMLTVPFFAFWKVTSFSYIISNVSETIKFGKTNIFVDEFTCTIACEDETSLEESDLVSFNAKKVFLNFSSLQKPVSLYHLIIFPCFRTDFTQNDWYVAEYFLTCWDSTVWNILHSFLIDLIRNGLLILVTNAL